jgi:Ricin-type beta-trefoil lectin domain
MHEISERKAGTPVRLPAMTGKGMKTLLITTTAGVLGMLTWATPAPARAATSQAALLSGNSPVHFKNVATGKCLDDSSSNGLRALGCNGDNNQMWQPGSTDPHFTLKDVATGKCLDDSSAFGLRAVTCVSGDGHQEWKINFPSGGDMLVNHNTGRCVDDSTEFGLRATTCASTSDTHQLWKT